MKYRMFNYIPGLYDNLRCALLKHVINLIACPLRKLKELIFTKLRWNSRCLSLGTGYSNAKEYVGRSSRKLNEKIEEQMLNSVVHVQL